MSNDKTMTVQERIIKLKAFASERKSGEPPFFKPIDKQLQELRDLYRADKSQFKNEYIERLKRIKEQREAMSKDYLMRKMHNANPSRVERRIDEGIAGTREDNKRMRGKQRSDMMKRNYE